MYELRPQKTAVVNITQVIDDVAVTNHSYFCGRYPNVHQFKSFFFICASFPLDQLFFLLLQKITQALQTKSSFSWYFNFGLLINTEAQNLLFLKIRN